MERGTIGENMSVEKMLTLKKIDTSTYLVLQSSTKLKDTLHTK